MYRVDAVFDTAAASSRRAREDRRRERRRDRRHPSHHGPQGARRDAHRQAVLAVPLRRPLLDPRPRASSAPRPSTASPARPRARRCPRAERGHPTCRSRRPPSRSNITDFFEIWQAPVRDRLRLVLNELGMGLAGRGDDLNDLLLRANPALVKARRVARDPRDASTHARAARSPTAPRDAAARGGPFRDAALRPRGGEDVAADGGARARARRGHRRPAAAAGALGRAR